MSVIDDVTQQGNSVNQAKLIGIVFVTVVVGVVAGGALWPAVSQYRAQSVAANEASTLAGRHRLAVHARLVDPASAQFRNVVQSRLVDWAFCGEVNAKNRLGGMAGFKRYVALVPGGQEQREKDIAIIDSDAPNLTPVERSQHEFFVTAWSIYCG